ncbi:MAG: SMP-30/gluconolactonase/LRE family protein [Candidatus Eisenbacteria bacterium]
MYGQKILGTAAVGALCVLTLFVPAEVRAQGDFIDFESDQWVLADAEIVEHLGRTSLAGMAYLNGVEFENGIIEVDIAVDGRRAYPGINFRMQSPADYERLYVRPHRAGLYPDAIQYTPVINRIAGWQLYSGEGYTAGAEVTENEWTRLRIEVLGKQAKVYWGDMDTPALEINELEHGISSGMIGLMCERDGSAYFSNFTYRSDADLEFAPPPPQETPPGVISEWQISQAFVVSRVDLEEHPDSQGLTGIAWQDVTSKPSGLVDVARYTGRLGREPDCIFARTTIMADEAGIREYLFGYSDWIAVFLNGRILFSANSAYRQRDPSFLGIIGLNDALYLPLEEGENELLIAVAEGFGGWGFMWQDADAVFEHETVRKAWETDDVFAIPECVAYDAAGDVLYVSNYDAYNVSNNQGLQAISRVSLDGLIEDLNWATGLNNPTGMEVHEDRLFVVERAGVVEIDAANGEIVERHPIPEAGFLNDIAIDAAGTMYVSDSRNSVIFGYTDDGFKEWLKSDDIQNPNGIRVDGDRLLVGNNGDNRLKAVDLATREVTTVTQLSQGIIDGVEVDGGGNYIVSHWEGRVYRISPAGEIVKLLDTSVVGTSCADIEYVPGQDLIVIPTFRGNSVAAYELSD